MNTDRREVAFLQQSVELCSSGDRLDKDTDLSCQLGFVISSKRGADLVKLEVVEQIVELPVLFLLLELEEVLLKTMESQLGLVVDVDFEWLVKSARRNRDTGSK